MVSVWRRAAFRCLVAAVLLAGCSGPGPAPSPAPGLTGTPVQPATTIPALASDTPPPTPELPTATPEPLAASVNGQDISLAVYQQEVARCQAGLTDAGYDSAVCPQAALQSLIEQRLLEQAAAAAGLAVDEAEVARALAEIEADLGGPDALAAWLEANFYTPADFRAALAADQLRARAAERATASIGPTAEQVHARMIVVTSEATANTLLSQLQSGSNFATVAVNYSRDLSSRAAGGDLGWFPRGVLTVPEVEAAAFSLQPGEFSPVFSSDLGFHIVQTLEHDPARPLSPAAAQTLRAAAFQAWLDQLAAEADIVRYVDL